MGGGCGGPCYEEVKKTAAQIALEHIKAAERRKKLEYWFWKCAANISEAVAVSFLIYLAWVLFPRQREILISWLMAHI